METSPITFTEEAVSKVEELLNREGRDDLRLRVGVSAGGCSGLVYQTYFDERVLDNDSIYEVGNFEVLIDKTSEPYLTGTTIGYKDDIYSQGFTMDNPNASGACACGDSFH